MRRCIFSRRGSMSAVGSGCVGSSGFAASAMSWSMRAELAWAVLSASACLNGSAIALFACSMRVMASWRRVSTSAASRGREDSLFSSCLMVPTSAASKLLRDIWVVALGTPSMRTSTVAWSSSPARDELGAQFMAAEGGDGAEFVVSIEVHEPVALPTCPCLEGCGSVGPVV